MAREERFSLGTKIDLLFLDLLELLRLATYATQNKKVSLLTEAVIKMDSLRFFLQVAWEAKLIPTKQFEHMATKVEEVGRMIGGWRKGLLAKTSPGKGEERNG